MHHRVDGEVLRLPEGDARGKKLLDAGLLVRWNPIPRARSQNLFESSRRWRFAEPFDDAAAVVQRNDKFSVHVCRPAVEICPAKPDRRAGLTTVDLPLKV